MTSNTITILKVTSLSSNNRSIGGDGRYIMIFFFGGRYDEILKNMLCSCCITRIVTHRNTSLDNV